jgi:hypothetical protein
MLFWSTILHLNLSIILLVVNYFDFDFIFIVIALRYGMKSYFILRICVIAQCLFEFVCSFTPAVPDVLDGRLSVL